MCILLTQNENRADKMSDIANAMAEAISNLCQCIYTESFIFDGQLFCDDNRNEIVYQAQFTGTVINTSEDIRNLTQEWVFLNPFLSINGQPYKLDSSCSVIVEVLGQSTCDSILPTTDYTSFPEATLRTAPVASPFELAAVVGVGIVVLLLVLLVIGLIAFVIARKTRKKYDVNRYY